MGSETGVGFYSLRLFLTCNGMRFPSSVPPVSLLMGFAVCGWCPIMAGSLQDAPADSETFFR